MRNKIKTDPLFIALREFLTTELHPHTISITFHRSQGGWDSPGIAHYLAQDNIRAIFSIQRSTHPGSTYPGIKIELLGTTVSIFRRTYDCGMIDHFAVTRVDLSDPNSLEQILKAINSFNWQTGHIVWISDNPIQKRQET